MHPRRNAGHQQGQTWETNEWKMLHGLGDKRIEMLHGQQKRPGRQMNRNATWPGKGRTPAVTDVADKCIEMLHGQQKRADTTSDRPGRQMNRNAAWPSEKGGHQQ